MDRSVATLARRDITFCCARPIFDGCRSDSHLGSWSPGSTAGPAAAAFRSTPAAAARADYGALPAATPLHEVRRAGRGHSDRLDDPAASGCL